MIHHLNKDVFESPQSHILAHAISSDLKLGAGIAREIQKRYHVRELIRSQDHQVGQAVLTKSNNRLIYNLVTKSKFFDKPNYRDIQNTLVDLKNKMLLQGHKILAIPEICCGLDGKNLNIILKILHEIFANTGIEIYMYHL